jgi:amino acid transporter
MRAAITFNRGGFSMSGLDNPYGAPDAPLGTAPTSANADTVPITDKTKAFIAKAGPWATFMGVLTFIGVGFMVLLAIVLTFALGFASSLSDSLSFLKPLGAAAGGAMGLFYLLLALLLFFPGLFLVNIGKASKKYRLRGEPGDLEKYAESVKKLLKFYGIFTIVVLSIYVVVIFVAIIAAVVGSAH